MARKLTRTWLGKGLLISFALTTVVYLLRGFGLLSMMPGFILLALVGLTISFAFVLSLQR